MRIIRRGSSGRGVNSGALRVLFIITIRLRWQWIMMTVVIIESDYVITCHALNMRSDWFFL